MARKLLMQVLPTNLPELEGPLPIFLSTKATEIPRCPNIDVSEFYPGFMIQMDLSFFNVESIRGFTSKFVAICSATSYHFGFPHRRKFPYIDIIKLIVTKLSNKDKKFHSYGWIEILHWKDPLNL